MPLAVPRQQRRRWRPVLIEMSTQAGEPFGDDVDLPPYVEVIIDRGEDIEWVERSNAAAGQYR